MHTTRALSPSPPARRALAALLALLLALSMLPLTAFADQVAGPNATIDPPDNVSAMALSEASIFVTWDPVDGADSYWVYGRDSGSNDFSLIDVQSVPNYVSDSLAPGTTYYYYVVAYKGGESSAPSSVASATTDEAAHAITYYRNYPDSSGDTEFASGGNFLVGANVPLSGIDAVGTFGANWSRADLKFKGWMDEYDQVMSAGTVVSMPDRPLALTAVWETPRVMVYLGNGADEDTVPVDNQRYFSGDPVTVSSIVPVWPGHTFGGWHNLVTGQVLQPGDTFPMSEYGALLLAQWPEQADASNNTLVLDNDNLLLGDTVSFTATGDRQDATGTADGDTRYIPVKWTMNPFFDIPFANTHPFTDSAVALNLGPQSVTVTFDKQAYNASTGMWASTGETTTLSKPFTVREHVQPLTYHRNYAFDDTTSTSGGDFAPNALVPLSDIVSVGTDGENWTRSGHRFLGWSEDPQSSWGLTEWYPMPDAPLDLYAIWGSLYTVTYDGDGADGGIVPVDNNEYTAYEEVHVPADTPTKTGYTFGGWLNVLNGQVYQPNNIFYMPEEGAYLKALWAEHADQGQNTLVIDDDDLISGETMTFTATGHRQDVQGSAGGETRFIPVSWTIESVLPFLPFANQHPFTGSYVTNAPGTYTLTAVFVEEFYNICCGTWDPTGQCVSLSAPFTVRAPGAYAVVYDGNGHDGGTVPVDALAYAKDDAVTVATGEPTKAGHVFAGWKADHDGKVYRAGDTFAMPEGGARLVAQWTPQATPGPNGQLAKPGTPAALSKAGFLPKTGDEAVPFVLLGVAAAAGALGVRSLRRKAE